jgi:hypothetical protein
MKNEGDIVSSDAMKTYKVKMERLDDKLESARIMAVSLGQKKFMTPFKTMNSPLGGYLFEIYQPLNEKLIKDSCEMRTVLDRLPGKCRSDTINLIIPKYEDTTISDKSICDLENRIHPLTDIVIVPRWDGILKSSNESNLPDSLWSMSKRYIEEVRRINGKLIMGNIPIHRPQSLIDKLIDEYFREGITSFLLDYETCQAPGKAHILRGITKKLIEYDYYEESLLYQVNMKKSHDYGSIKPADNLLSFINGIDILGNYHMRGGGGSTVKLFSPSDWTYYDDNLGNRTLDDVNNNNHMLINKETDIVKREIRESGTALKIAKTKLGAREYIQRINQTSLVFGGIGWA